MNLESLLSFLTFHELVSPIAMVLTGLLTLGFFRLFQDYKSRQLESSFSKNRRSMWLEQAFSRFESRARFSWILMGFGSLWLLQLVVESAWAG